MKNRRHVAAGLLAALLLAPFLALAQPSAPPTTSAFTLEQCLQFALQNQPLLRQTRIDEEANEADIRIGRAGCPSWA